MSRIGRKTINIPAGVDVVLAPGNLLTVKKDKLEMVRQLHPAMEISIVGDTITVNRPTDSKEHRSLHGLTRTLIANTVEGVVNGFSKTLEIHGVGYRAVKQGETAVLNIGYSHQVIITEIPGIKIDIPNQTTIVISGPDKQVVGQFAAEVRSKRPPEVYHGKGIRYAGEFVRHKEGKTGKAKK